MNITCESPLGDDLGLLMQRHTEAMHADSPPESIHMMDASALAHPDIRFFVLRDEGRAVGMGAFKRLDATHAEIKSMHILSEQRGKGFAQAMLAHLIAEADAAGITRLSLETGSQPSFTAARALYLRAGFEVCDPFGTYSLDPNSAFMTKTITPTP